MTETPAGPTADAEAVPAAAEAVPAAAEAVPADADADAAEATPASSTAAELERKAAELSVRSLLEAGAHFGHQTQRWNPKMKPFIFGQRNGTHIIDLDQTLPMFAEALEFLRDTCAEGGNVLFVGTKRQSATSVEAEALRSKQYYVNNRWLGGMLTNWKTVKKSIDRYKSILETLGDEERKSEFSKKELSRLSRLGEKYRKSLHGIREMARLPSAVFVIDVSKEQIAVSEARRLGIPIVAMVDSNCNPDGIDFVVPANDDAIRAIDLYCRLVADACIDGARIHNERVQSETHAQPTAAGPGIGRRVVEIKQAPRRSRSQQGVTSGRTQSAGGRSEEGGAAPKAPHPESAEPAAAPVAEETTTTPTDGEG